MSVSVSVLTTRYGRPAAALHFGQVIGNRQSRASIWFEPPWEFQPYQQSTGVATRVNPAPRIISRLGQLTLVVAPGTRIGPYLIGLPLGRGGMGEVYRAHDTRLNRDVAVKVLPPAFAEDPERRSRFTLEARALAALNHPHIAQIYGVEQSGDTSALVMELVEGDTLADRIARGPVPIEDTIAIARQIAAALEAAHDAGIIHRDLKPANIKLREDGTVKVLDFGLAKHVEPSATSGAGADSPTITSPAMTHAGVILGTASYMSPEQARGKPVDKRADIWAFGCVVFELLTATRAFDGATVTDVIAAVVHKDPDWHRLPRATPPWMRTLLSRCLQKDARQRLRDIGDARLEIDSPHLESATAVRPGSSRAWIWIATGIVATMAAGIGLWTLRRPERSADPFAVRFQRVTLDASYAAAPAISPDGSLVVYASDRDEPGQLDLWLQRTGSGQPRRLTSEPGDDTEPAISPDGGTIAFRSARGGGGIYAMPTLGGDARLIAAGGRQPKFSPDGSFIAYWVGSRLGGPSQANTALYVVPANGGAPVPVAESFYAATSAVWAPDGRSLLFFGVERRSQNGTTVSDWWWTPFPAAGHPVQTGVYQLLAERNLFGEFVNNTIAVAPDALPSAWTRPGLIFSARLGESINLWRVAISTTDGHVQPDSLERLTQGVGADRNAAADASGRIVFEVTNTSVVALTLPIDGNNAKVLGPAEVRATDSSSAVDGRVSLDLEGHLLAHPRHRPNESEVWIKDLRTGIDRHLVTTPPSQLNPIISPDAKRTAYTVSEGTDSAGYVIATTGGIASKVCTDCVLQGWLPDSKRITAFGRTPRGNVKLIDVDRGTSQLLLDALVGRVEVSPDEHWVSFVHERAQWITRLGPHPPMPTTEWTKLVDFTDGTDRSCGWSQDGRILYLLLNRDGYRDLYGLRLDPTRGVALGDPFVVQHFHDARRQWGSTTYGNAVVKNAFVFHQRETASTIWIMQRQ
ncbi:MAG TPA: protein kinase [Vicinamibacterales bacterium]|nr:protein kinase [Vicinamibacterales bacterium]